MLADAARLAPDRLRLRVLPASPTARVLDLTGLDRHLAVVRGQAPDPAR